VEYIKVSDLNNKITIKELTQYVEDILQDRTYENGDMRKYHSLI